MEEGNLETETDARREDEVKTPGERPRVGGDWSAASTRNIRDASKAPEPEERHGVALSRAFRAWPCPHHDCTLPDSRTGTQSTAVFLSHSVHGTL